jgi:hypothetical protein
MNEPHIDDLINEFKYKVKPTDAHQQLLDEITAFYKETEKLMTKKNVAAGKRARKHLLAAYHLCRQRRKEIIDTCHLIERGEL